MDRPLHYDRLGVPISLEEWSGLFEADDYKIIAQTPVADRWLVSTVWMGLDMGLGFIDGGPPIIFETMVFDTTSERSRSDLEVRRYATEDQAREGHWQMVQLVTVLETVGGTDPASS